MRRNLILFLSLMLTGIISKPVALLAATPQADQKSSKLHASYQRQPGVVEQDPDLLEQFERMRKLRGPGYDPRTRHRRQDGWAKYTNRLFLESSPYLLQHAHNPVNWYPWGDEAFETARRLKLPILLSVGYSTCHWCHVMEEESFEDEEIARYLNENYICIKVDREERPDLDAIYMSAVRALTGRGGWPMTVWLTPKREPFYGGTYFPARDGDRGSRRGFISLLREMKKLYDSQPDTIAKSSKKLAQQVRRMMTPRAGSGQVMPKILHTAADYYKRRFDKKNGGLSGSPKFPSGIAARFLLRYYRRTGDREVLNVVSHTLKKMSAGGMYDHVGGGFHRYSTDRRWLVPHFEKMLYDNALLIVSYLEAFQVTGDREFERVTREILRYIHRDMTSSEGAFYSATDADSMTPGGHREEGYFFTWTPQELEKALGPARARVVKKYYAVRSRGNFEGRNILHTPRTIEQVAEELNISQNKLRKMLKEAKDILYEQRFERMPPLRDEKILTAWNGLMISAHARAGLVLGDQRYIKRAAQAALFILQHMYKNGRLFRSYKDNMARHNAYLDDYAFFTAALLDLYEATHELNWLQKAIEFDTVLETYYEDKQDGGYYMISNDHEKLLAREKPGYDGAVPSGNSVAVMNLLRLGEFTSRSAYRKRADKALTCFSATLNSRPTALSEMLQAVDFSLDVPKEIIIVLPTNQKNGAKPFLTELRKHFVPNRIISVVEEGAELESHASLVPLVAKKFARKGKPTAYVCEMGSCELPTNDPKVFGKLIAKVQKLEDDGS